MYCVLLLFTGEYTDQCEDLAVSKCCVVYTLVHSTNGSTQIARCYHIIINIIYLLLVGEYIIIIIIIITY